MKIKFVFYVLPVLVIYVNSMKKFAGFSYGPVVKIRKSHKDDVGLLQHELTHSKQWYRTLGLWWLLYRFAKRCYRYELEAYAVQLKYADDYEAKLQKFVDLIVDMYGLKVTRENVESDLRKAS